MRADQGIERSDWSPELLEVAANLSIDSGGAFVEGKNQKEVGDPLDRPSRPHGVLAFLGAEHQLSDRDGRDGPRGGPAAALTRSPGSGGARNAPILLRA